MGQREDSRGAEAPMGDSARRVGGGSYTASEHSNAQMGVSESRGYFIGVLIILPFWGYFRGPLFSKSPKSVSEH